jgi:anti-sigma factor RsiW
MGREFMSDSYTNQLSAYLDGELDSISRSRLEAHLTTCRECAAVLADLRAIVAAAPFYPGRQPSRELWGALEARLDEVEVIPLASSRPPVVPSSRRFSWPQLIAASFLMAALGGGGTWLALRQRAPAGAAVATQPTSPVVSQPAVQAVAVHTFAYAEAQYDSAVLDLERILQNGRGRLDSTTVRTIEESLRKIDVAIAEAHSAIQRDPANAYLNRQIAANMRRKLDLLRVATKAIATQS